MSPILPIFRISIKIPLPFLELQRYSTKVTCPVDIDKNRAACVRLCACRRIRIRTHTSKPAYRAARALEKPCALHSTLSCTATLEVIKRFIGTSYNFRRQIILTYLLKLSKILLKKVVPCLIKS